MINWNDIRVEQEIAQERYQTIIQGQQVDRASSAKEKGQAETSIFSWVFGWFNRQPVASC
jgi:hypothetical protein